MPSDNILQTISICIKEILPSVTDDQINVNVSLKDLGANSIDRVDIIMGVMEALDIDVEIYEFTKAKNIGGILEIFENKASELV